jgi:hypothetical protein
MPEPLSPLILVPSPKVVSIEEWRQAAPRAPALIGRTPMVDDDGTGEYGTVLNNAWKQEFYNQIDAALTSNYNNALAAAVADPNLNLNVLVQQTPTGTVNDWTVAGRTRNTVVIWDGAADGQINGIVGGVKGDRLTFLNYSSSSKVLRFGHQQTGSAVGGRISNVATSAPTPIASFGGWATYFHNGTGWFLIGHDQGPWITPIYNAADYAAAATTWTVEAGDINTCCYLLRGRTLHFHFHINTTSVGAATTILYRSVPGGFTPTKLMVVPIIVSNVNVAAFGYAFVNPASGAIVQFVNSAGAGSWAAQTNGANVLGELALEVN